MLIHGGIVMCACGENAARYINSKGELCCGICPIKQGLDSIKLDDVPQLLGWARITIEYLKGKVGHVPAGDSIQKMLGDQAAVACADPECNKACACHFRGWGGHSESLCFHACASSDVQLYCAHCRQPKGTHGTYCAYVSGSVPASWRTKPGVPHCEVCWTVLDRAGNCDRCYRESIS